jgi:cytidylate kinase
LRVSAHNHGLKIAIDGPAGAGKSTIGRGLAEALSCAYLDTGVMYRAVTLAALRAGLDLSDQAALAGLASTLDFAWSADTPVEVLVNGRRAGAELRASEVDANVSQVSAHSRVRGVLVARQRALAARGCVVMVGRDIGTVVLPDAPVKLWVTASADERARRRRAELGARSDDQSAVAGKLQHRDKADANRAASPAVPAHDSEILTTDGLTPSESVLAALSRVEEAIGREPASAP